MRYAPHTDADVRVALDAIGAESVGELFEGIPAELLDPELDLPAALDEVALTDHMRALADRNDAASPSFLGGGVRRHFVPAVTRHLAMQSEFVTAYTPYQPEVSQGILQATFEYQTIMSELTGLPVSNASMYDGASSVAEAALLAMRATRRDRVVVSRGVHPEAREVTETYLAPLEARLDVLDLDDLVTPAPGDLEGAAALIVQSPNFLGRLEDMTAMADAAHAAGALFVAVADPVSLAILRSPGEVGADVAVGDGQTLGVPLQYGGPHFGFMVVTEALLRQLPGRLVGQTHDVDGRRGFALTLQAREQHIRRGKAKSNICSNHQLAALMATVNACALGPQGLREMAEGTVRNAHALADRLAGEGYDVLRDGRFFAEVPMRVSRDPAELRRDLQRAGVRAGLPVPREYGLGDAILLTATELTRPADVDALLAALRAVGERPREVAHG
ncbi:MAG: aminomethyl-transferring glycine dehydrogenase subunit GcvPA [Deinococcus-Thermus bacterium]|nr:aminomethyl-transferring glycine dehydrogenase subunit GcvPA [Deinococcota bacterium]